MKRTKSYNYTICSILFNREKSIVMQFSDIFHQEDIQQGGERVISILNANGHSFNPFELYC